MGWKVYRLTKKELCHSNETWHALNSTFHDTNCNVSFQINPHWISNSGLWKVVLHACRECMAWKNWRREACLSRRMIFVHVGEQKIVRWCQIRRLWRVINQFKATVTPSSHCSHRLVCRSIVLVKQDSLRQFPGRSTKASIQVVLLFNVLYYLSSVGLSGSRKGWI